MSSKSRGGLSQREYDAKLAGKPMPYASKSKILSSSQAKSAASSSVKSSGSSKDLIKAQKEYLSSLKPSSAETGALSSLDKLNQGLETGTKNITDARLNPVAQTFQQGQINALSNQTDTASIPLKYQIAALQSARQAKSTIAGAKVGYATDTITRSAANTKVQSDQAYRNLQMQNIQSTIDKRGKTGGGKKSSLEDTIDTLISSGKGWHDTAETLRSSGVNVNHGSKADILLNKRLAPAKRSK